METTLSISTETLAQAVEAYSTRLAECRANEMPRSLAHDFAIEAALTVVLVADESICGEAVYAALDAVRAAVLASTLAELNAFRTQTE